MAKKNAKSGKKVSAKKVNASEANEPKFSASDLERLRKPVLSANTALARAQDEAKGLTEKARTLVTETKMAYLKVLSPYREACAEAGVKCEFEGARGANVSEMVRFEVVKTEKGIRIAIKGKPRTEEFIPLGAFKDTSISAVAYAFTEKHLGSRKEIGNKGGGLGNRIRALLAGKKS